MTWNPLALDSAYNVLASADSGKLVASSGYLPYGDAPPWAVGSLPRFTGERRDPVTGVYHLGNGYRAYDSVLMRFTCPDAFSPFGPGGINPYVYCAGDPVNHADPSGHLSWQAAVGVATGGLGILLAIFTAGASIAAEASVLAALRATSKLKLIGGAAGVFADITGIASASTEDTNAQASEVLGWTSLAAGLLSNGLEMTDKTSQILTTVKQKTVAAVSPRSSRVGPSRASSTSTSTSTTDSVDVVLRQHRSGASAGSGGGSSAKSGHASHASGAPHRGTHTQQRNANKSKDRSTARYAWTADSHDGGDRHAGTLSSHGVASSDPHAHRQSGSHDAAAHDEHASAVASHAIAPASAQIHVSHATGRQARKMKLPWVPHGPELV